MMGWGILAKKPRVADRVWPCTDFEPGVGIDRKFGVSSSLSDVCDPYNLSYKPG
jgi:hypothetical protein